MTDELTKRAGDMAASLTGEFHRRDYVLQAHHAAEMVKALLQDYKYALPSVELMQTIAALDALILTPPVDPFLDAVNEAFPHVNVEFLAGKLKDALAKRGLELREGGGE